MGSKKFEELMFPTYGDLRRGDFESGDRFYSNFGEMATPNPSPTSPSFPSWSNFSAGSTGSDDYQSFFPGRVVTNQGNEMARVGTPANSLNVSPIFRGSPYDFRYSQPTNNFTPMPPTSSSASGGRYRRDPPSVRMGLTKKTKYNFCVFCKNNDEEEATYLGHTLKDDSGLITCPILQHYVCPICGATGPVSHTIKYCPENKGDKYHEKHGASITELKSLRSSTGKLRGARSGADSKNDSLPLTLTPVGTPLIRGSALPRPMRPVLGSGASDIPPMLGELINDQRRQGQPFDFQQ